MSKLRKSDKYLSKVRKLDKYHKEDKNKRLTMVVPATRSARAINSDENGDGRDGPLNLDKSRKKWSS